MSEKYRETVIWEDLNLSYHSDNNVREIRKVTMQEIDSVYSLMLKVMESNNAPHYSPSEYEYYRSRVEDHGAIIGAFYEGELVAYSVLDFVGAGEDNYGWLTGVDEVELLRVALMAGCVVCPSHRGEGLQMQLLRARESYALKKGCLHLFALASPDNEYSLKNLKNYGFGVSIENRDMGWGVRHVLYKRAGHNTALYDSATLITDRHPISGRPRTYPINKKSQWSNLY